MQIIDTKEAPGAIGPYSQAVFTDDLMFISGQVAIDPQTGQLVTTSIKAECEQVLQNIGAIVKAAGIPLGNVVKTTIFLQDMNDFSAVNAIYGAFFAKPYPARSTVAVAKLPLGARVEIEAIVRLPR